ncbi:unnamed protein product [Adineta steineri]|uniref:AIG1-type G domain-containing protein n=1 Tax=Adineta steineri TaxID=433720 RepID=A0A814K1G8_9BILA|nr:unnamed protein product [Adineta steineri]CAF1044894.1 unnamed protein product [Adineta steineri]
MKISENFYYFSSSERNAQSIGIILLGKSGVGKSFLANILLNHDDFVDKISVSSVTHRTESREFEYLGQTYVIFDVPGLIENDQDAIQKNKAEIQKAFEQHPFSVVAFVLNVAGTGRLDTQDMVVFNVLNDAYQFKTVIIGENREDKQRNVIGYNCIYRYDITTGCWQRFPAEYSNLVFNRVRVSNYQEQLVTVIKPLHEQFSDLEQLSNQNKLTLPSISKEERIPEDIVDYGSRSELNSLAPPPVASRRSRQNSTCSVRYASFVPLAAAPVRRRCVIESILLHVQRKKNTFEKIIDIIKRREAITMFDLGLRFLRVYDSRFNYREGHEFVMSYRKKTWFLTIVKITYVDCEVGNIEPRSLLILNYKGQYTSVHI